MSDTAKNTAQPIRFEAGGILRLVDGASSYVFAALEPGSLEIDAGGYEPLNYTDRGEQQAPLEGDERLTTVKVRAKLTRGTGAGELVTLSSARDATAGLMKIYQLEIEIPHFKGASAKQKMVLANTYFTKPAMVKASERYDTVELEMQSTEPNPTWSTV